MEPIFRRIRIPILGAFVLCSTATSALAAGSLKQTGPDVYEGDPCGYLVYAGCEPVWRLIDNRWESYCHCRQTVGPEYSVTGPGGVY